MNGMLLAAGRGERMEPLSRFVPKPALDVLGTPLLGGSFRQLRQLGCDPLVVNLHRHPTTVAAAARACEPTFAGLRFSWEDDLLGGAGGLAAARRHFAPGPVLAANADVAAELDLAPLTCVTRADVVVLALIRHPDPARWSSVLVDDEGVVSAILPAGEAGGEAGFLFTGFQLLGAEVVAALPEPPAHMDALWEPLRRKHLLRGAVVCGRFREAGTPAAYRELVVAAIEGRQWSHPDALVHRDTALERSAVSAGCVVEAGAQLSGTVVTAGAAVGRHCQLDGCVVAGPIRVEDGTQLRDRLILPSGDWPL